MPKNNSPVVILVRPQMGENIGAVARAMSNFGLSELRIAAPRDGWPNEKALEMASGAAHIIESAKIYPDFPAAMQGIQLAYATSARPRDMEKRVVSPEGAMQEIHENSAACALIFGPERAGLTNDDISWCDTLVTIPTAGENASLNIAQSAVIMGYAWMRQQNTNVLSKSHPDIAPKEEWHDMFAQLEGYLDAAEYFRVAHKKPVMWQNLKNMLQRAQFSSQELRTFRGMLRSLWQRSTHDE